MLISWYPYPDFTLLPRIFGDLGYHPDHQASGKLALDAQFDSTVDLLFPLTGPAWQVSQYYMCVLTLLEGMLCCDSNDCSLLRINFSSPTVYLPVPSSAVTAQVNAFLQHKSQYPNATAVSEGLFELAAHTAEVVGCSEDYAIAFTAYY